MTHQPWMERVQLLDCQGRVSHTLTLLLDGCVEVRFAGSGVAAIVDPIHRACLTPGVHIHDDLMDAAAGLRPG
jgi:hypothetical protein